MLLDYKIDMRLVFYQSVCAVRKYMYGVRKSKSWLSLSLMFWVYTYLGMRACSSTNLSVLLEKYMYGVRKSKSWLSLSLCSGYILIWE